MVYVPAGEFLMGSILEGEQDEHPQHKVYLTGYWIYKYEVTVAQYRQFCLATKRDMPPAPSWGWQDDHPIVNVNWDDAAAYASWAGASLPTEAQWEKAARGANGQVYPWGNVWDGTKCSNLVGLKALPSPPSHVGSFPAGASPYGALDMAGSVWEWCADWFGFEYYKNAPHWNPTGPKTGTYRVLRGGSWITESPDYFRAAYRYSYSVPKSEFFINIGFRCVVRSPHWEAANHTATIYEQC